MYPLRVTPLDVCIQYREAFHRLYGAEYEPHDASYVDAVMEQTVGHWNRYVRAGPDGLDPRNAGLVPLDPLVDAPFHTPAPARRDETLSQVFLDARSARSDSTGGAPEGSTIAGLGSQTMQTVLEPVPQSPEEGTASLLLEAAPAEENSLAARISQARNTLLRKCFSPAALPKRPESGVAGTPQWGSSADGTDFGRLMGLAPGRSLMRPFFNAHGIAKKCGDPGCGAWKEQPEPEGPTLDCSAAHTVNAFNWASRLLSSRSGYAVSIPVVTCVDCEGPTDIALACNLDPEVVGAHSPHPFVIRLYYACRTPVKGAGECTGRELPGVEEHYEFARNRGNAGCVPPSQKPGLCYPKVTKSITRSPP